jgi:hypothetical protein
MNIIDYVNRVFTSENLDVNIECLGVNEEVIYLLKLCDICIKKERLNEAWQNIIDCVAEKFANEEVNTFFSSDILSFLIDNQIDLIGLGHLRLEDKWLIKIIEREPRCWEAKHTLEERDRKIRY